MLWTICKWLENYVQSMLRAAAFYDVESELVFHLFYTHSASLDKFDLTLQPQYEIDLKPQHHVCYGMPILLQSGNKDSYAIYMLLNDDWFPLLSIICSTHSHVFGFQQRLA